MSSFDWGAVGGKAADMQDADRRKKEESSKSFGSQLGSVYRDGVQNERDTALGQTKK